MLIRVLVVDDFAPFRTFIASTLQKLPELQIISEVSDGLEAVQKAQELQPDLILLDVGLPKLNGIDAARRIKKVSPTSRILFMSQDSSADVVREALNLGAQGYVVKSDAGSELLSAVNAVLRGERFVSSGVVGQDFAGASVTRALEGVRPNRVSAPASRQNMKTAHRHEVGFYSTDRSLLDDLTQFIGAALKAGNAAIVVATESHRDSLLSRLQAHGVDIPTAIEQGRYIALDAAHTLSLVIFDGMPDPVRFFKLLRALIGTVAEAAQGKHPRVVACGECAPFLLAQGKLEAAIQVEKLWDEVSKIHDLDTLCVYSLASFHDELGSHIFQRICAEHSAVYAR